MYTDDELLQVDLDTLYVRDADGDLVSSNEPDPRSRRKPSQFYMTWCRTSFLCTFRGDVTRDQRRALTAWAKDAWQGSLDGPLPGLAKAAAILGADVAKAGGGPTYRFPEEIPPSLRAVRLAPDNVHYLEAGFSDCVGEVVSAQPFYMVLEDDHAVSICHTVRRSSRGCEAGADTREAYRGRGLVGEATTAWARAVREEGLEPFYSTWWANTASRRVADKLGLIHFASTMGLGY